MTPLSDDYFELMNTRTDHLHDWRHIPAQTTPQGISAQYQVCRTCADGGVLTVLTARADAAGHSSLSAEEEVALMCLAVAALGALSDLFPGGAS